MKTDRDLERQLASIDRRGYPAYKGLRGTYDFGLVFQSKCNATEWYAS